MTYSYRNAQLPLPPREKMAGRRGQKTNSEGGRIAPQTPRLPVRPLLASSGARRN